MLFSKLLTATGGHQLVFVGGTGQSSGGGDVRLNGYLTGGIADSPQVGDLVIYAVMGYFTSSPPSSTMSTPGYTLLKSVYTYNGTYLSNSAVFVYYKVFAAGDTQIANTGPFPGAKLVQVWRYASETSPFDVAATTAVGQGSTAVNPAAITTVTTGAVMLGIGFGRQQGISATQYTEAPAGTAYLTAVDNYRAASPGFPGLLLDVEGVNGIAASAPLIVPGTYNFGAFGPNVVDLNNAWAAVTIALRPRG